LEEILSRPEFGREKPKVPQMDVHFFDWVREEIPKEIAWPVLIILLVLMLILLGWFIYQWWGSRATIEKLELAKERDQPKSWFVHARQQAKRGEYRLAIRSLYHFVLAFAFEQRKLHLSSNQTNGEYRAALSRTWPSKAPLFHQLSIRFDEVWYGKRPVSDCDYEEYENKVKRFTESGE
jgi:hypothetical protein